MIKDQLFYVALKALIEKDGEILVLHDPNLGIDLPGGKIQIGETDLLKSLTREVAEETGLNIDIGDPFAADFFEFPQDINHRHAGKTIFVVFYKAKYISGEVKLSQEHDRFEWVSKNNYKNLVAITERYNNIITALKKFFED